MRTGAGSMCPTMATCGYRISPVIGRRIAMATGCMSLTMAGPGLAMSPGAGRLITMGVGCITTRAGPGGRDRCMAEHSIVRCGRRLMSHSSDGAAVGASAWAMGDGAASAGSRLVPAMASIHGGAVGEIATAW